MPEPFTGLYMMLMMMVCICALAESSTEFIDCIELSFGIIISCTKCLLCEKIFFFSLCGCLGYVYTAKEMRLFV